MKEYCQVNSTRSWTNKDDESKGIRNSPRSRDREIFLIDIVPGSGHRDGEKKDFGLGAGLHSLHQMEATQ